MNLRLVISGLAAGILLSAPTFAGAQEENGDETESVGSELTTDTSSEVPSEVPDELFESRVMDEITVTVGPDGRTAYELEMDRLAEHMQEVYREKRLREREEEEVAWRQADPDLDNPDSRIKWGYSAQAEQRMRRENDFLYDLPTDQTKPATLFRAEF